MTDSKEIDSEPALGGEGLTTSDNGQEASTDIVEPPETPAAPKAAPQASAGRKAPGSKDVIPFKWKLVGKSRGVVLTLFKAVEREEVEAQLRRACAEGYYANVRILDIDARVGPPPRAPSAKPDAKARKRAATKTGTEAQKTKRATPKAEKPKRTVAAKASAVSKPSAGPDRTKKAKTKKTKTAKIAKPKAAAKTRKKKTAGAKSTRKRTARKK